MTRRAWPPRVVAALAGAAALVLALAAPAAAHNSLVSVDPVDGSTVATAPKAVVLTFDEPALALGTQVVVTGPEGQVSGGSPRLVDETVLQELVADAPAGRYTVAWRVTSADGHPITGESSFTATAAGGGYAVPDRQSDAGDPAPTVPGWAWLLGGLAVLALVATAVVLVRRSRVRPPAG